MLYKQRVQEDLEKMQRLLESSITGLEKRAVDAQQLHKMLSDVKALVTNLQPLINRETEQR